MFKEVFKEFSNEKTRDFWWILEATLTERTNCTEVLERIKESASQVRWQCI